VKIVKVDAGRITSWSTFHEVFKEALGFPEFYGANMNAWIDCMTDVDDPAAGMTSVHVSPGQVLTLQLERIDDLVKSQKEIYEALVDSVAFVNWRRIEAGHEPVLALAYYKR
jgi:RNAse (barnase) inhibitor barstar